MLCSTGSGNRRSRDKEDRDCSLAGSRRCAREGIPNEGVEYGGVFSLCQGTDTELLVFVEARQIAGQREWQYAFAPFTDYQLAVSIDEEKVWESPDGTMAENGKPHYWDFADQRPKPDVEP